MSVEAFRESPWKGSHDAYEHSVFNIRPAPEFATGEVIVASTYRASGFANRSESEVPKEGRRFDKAAQRAVRAGGPMRVSADTWRNILHGAIESPKQPNQSSKRFLQLCPVVPDTALYSGSARLSANSWFPGELVKRMVRLGCATEQDAEALWARLHVALSVGENDDIWARWLQDEFEHRRSSADSWKPTLLNVTVTLPDHEKVGLRTPASQFVRDLSSVIDAKGSMTRRQWISLLESVLRLGTVSHVIWLCDVNARIWGAIQRVLDGEAAPTVADSLRSIVSGRGQYLVYGAPAIHTIREFASSYLVARLGINLTLWHLHDNGGKTASLSSATELVAFLQTIETKRDRLVAAGLRSELNHLRDSQARTVMCRKGIGSNLVEFCRHALGQRQTGDESLRGYDQGYQLKKRADYASAPWIVSLGPVAILAIVHCCLDEVSGPRSVQRLCEHLGFYGIAVDRDAIAKSDLGRQLRMLGLVLDSPDAESGMLLIPPFELTGSTREGKAE